MENKSLKYGNVIVSSRADQTLTYSKYIKDERTGKNVGAVLEDLSVVDDDGNNSVIIRDGAITADKLSDDAIKKTTEVAISSIPIIENTDIDKIFNL